MAKKTSSTTTFATTLQYYLEDSDWEREVRVLQLPYISPAKHSAWDEVKAFWIVLRAAMKEQALLLSSISGRYHPDLWATIIIGFLPKRYRPVIGMAGDMWRPSGGWRHFLGKWIVRLADRSIQRYLVQSSDEVELFPQLWKISQDKVRCCLFFPTMKAEDIAEPPPPPGTHIFAGGNSLRDYNQVVEAARLMPDHEFRLVTTLLDDHPDLPANVTVGGTTFPEFIRLMRSAAVVVVPVRQGIRRNAGMATLLNAMLIGKPVVANDALGVRDHLEDKVSGMVVDGSPESYVAALGWMLDPANQSALEQMGKTAEATVREKFSYERHLHCLMTSMRELITEAQLP